MRALTEVLLRHPRVWILSDEIYAPFCYGAEAHVSPCLLYTSRCV